MDPLQATADRSLVVMRHAKAAATAPSDHERPLAERGTQDAVDAGRWLAGEGVRPDHVLVSDALRARQTWEALAEGAGWDLAPEWSAGLYAAGPEAALDLIREVPASAGCLLVIGHNPTAAYLAELLDDGNGDVEAGTSLVTGGFPTCAVAVFSFAGEWADLAPTSASLRRYYVGRS